MGIETPKIERPKEEAEENKLQEQRMISDAELIRGGAKIEEGVLRPTEEQIEEIRSKLRNEAEKEKADYDPEHEERILEISRQIDKASDNDLLEMMELKSINPEKFESLFNKELDWDSVRASIDKELLQNTNETRRNQDYLERAGFFKEISGNEFDKNIQIQEKVYDKVLKQCKHSLTPSFYDIGLFGRDAQLIRGMYDGASLKILNPEKFNDKIKITDKVREEMQNLLKGDSRWASDKRWVSRSARILGISEEKKEK